MAGKVKRVVSSVVIFILNNAYGLVYRSIVAHTGGGEGKSWVEWRTNLERVGKYELFVHIPEFSAMNIMYKSNLLSQRGTQSYTIVLLEARYEISINTSDYGWISLGEYESTSGECVVMLHDTGDPNHIIIGDAVKWVYVGERG
ncbi:golvesin C-terminal-like domain-containing protein [Butyricimonas faecihominis]